MNFVTGLPGIKKNSKLKFGVIRVAPRYAITAPTIQTRMIHTLPCGESTSLANTYKNMNFTNMLISIWQCLKRH